MYSHRKITTASLYYRCFHRGFTNIFFTSVSKAWSTLFLFLFFTSLLSNLSPALGSSKPSKKAEQTSKVTLRKGDPKIGKIKSTPCAACHGKTGISSIPSYPHLSGQHMRYLIEQTLAIKIGTRSVPEMAQSVQNISQQDIIDIAAYYSTQTAPKGATEKELFTLGESLYRSGQKQKNQGACSSCHSFNGSGNSLSGYPKVSGQSVEYLVKQLQDFRSGKRSNTSNAKIMQAVAEKLSDNEIAALASYISGLRDNDTHTNKKNTVNTL